MQTLLKAKGAKVFAWLEQGAAIYGCGDASRMARDVDQSLRDITMTHGVRDADAADFISTPWLRGIDTIERLTTDKTWSLCPRLDC